MASQLRAALTQLRPCTQGASWLNAPVRSPHRWRKKGLSFESFKIRCARRCSRPCRGALKGEARGEGGWVLGRATFVRGQSRAVRRSATLCTPQRSSNSDGSWLRWNANTTWRGKRRRWKRARRRRSRRRSRSLSSRSSGRATPRNGRRARAPAPPLPAPSHQRGSSGAAPLVRPA